MVKGVIFYEGPSMLDGKPIVAVATPATDNRKTGDMIQTWILRRNIDPVRAVATGADRSICGDCFHRGAPDRPRTCYVNIGQAPLAVWRAYRRGSYERGSLAGLVERLGGKPVRMGAYGDPVAVPWQSWTGIHDARLWTGYTHQWRQLIATPFRNVLMASCDNALEMAEAAAAGWRAFRVTAIGESAPAGAIECPASKGAECASCGLCSGLQRQAAPHIFIPAHGTAKRFVGAP